MDQEKPVRMDVAGYFVDGELVKIKNLDAPFQEWTTDPITRSSLLQLLGLDKVQK